MRFKDFKIKFILNELLPKGKPITREMGKPERLDYFSNVDNYKIANGGALGLSARTCNNQNSNFCDAGTGCGDCWLKVPSDLNLLYGESITLF